MRTTVDIHLRSKLPFTQTDLGSPPLNPFPKRKSLLWKMSKAVAAFLGVQKTWQVVLICLAIFLIVVGFAVAFGSILYPIFQTVSAGSINTH